MPPMSIEAMARGSESDAASVVISAMATNPNHIAIWKGQGEKQLARQRALVRLLLQRTPTENVLIASDDGRPVGMLRMARYPSCQMSPIQSLALLPGVVASQRSTTGRVLKWFSTWAKHDPGDKDHWHLGPVGVLPERQGQRIGTQLMERFLERVDEDGIGAYLETDKSGNVGYYERFGFGTTGTDEVSGVTNWFMWRPPR